jgi:hypothetical protein
VCSVGACALRVVQMTDSKASAVSGLAHKQTTPRMAAVGVALSGVLLPELTRIICEYQRPGHRFDAERVRSELLTVPADGQSFVTFARAPGPVTGNPALLSGPVTRCAMVQSAGASISRSAIGAVGSESATFALGPRLPPLKWPMTIFSRHLPMSAILLTEQFVPIRQ